jgi:hypothetical protein
MRQQQGRLVFLDETSTNTKMTRTRGRFVKGERLKSKAPFGHWCTQTLIAGLRSGGLVAPFVVNAPMNRAIFDTYVETQLAPVLVPGDVVILDNLAAHKSQKAENILRSRGAWLLFLPPPAFAGAGSTAQTSIRSRWLSPNSKPISEKPPHEPSTTSGKPLETFASSSHQTNAQTTSMQQDTDSNDRPML